MSRHQTLPEGLPAAGYRSKATLAFHARVLSWNMVGKMSFLESCSLHKIENMESFPHEAAGGTQRGAFEGCGLTELLERPNEVGLKGVAYRTHPLGSSTAVQLWASVCHQHGTVQRRLCEELALSHQAHSHLSRQVSEDYILTEAARVFCGPEREPKSR